MNPLAASFAIFEEATLPALRRKSERLTAYLEYLIDRMQTGVETRSRVVTVITPRDPQARGCQLSLRVQDRPRDWFKALRAEGLVCDFREPDVIRVAPAPLFNTFHDVWVFADVLAREIK